MNLHWTLLVGGVLAPFTLFSAESEITIEHAEGAAGFKFERIQTPRRNDAAAKRTFTLVDGQRDSNGAELSALNDGLLPSEEDQPGANFFFGAGTGGGRIALDLGAAVEIAAINTYSWHPGGRGPQVYTVYGADSGAGLVTDPKRPMDPARNGWTLIAKVDTRTASSEKGGQYAASVSGKGGLLGRYRHLLWDIAPTDAADPFGQTFFSEIDVVEKNPAPEPEQTNLVADTSAHRKTIEVEGGYKVLLDTSETTDLTEWADQALVPMIKEWYPKIVAMLPSEGYEAPKSLSIHIRQNKAGVADTAGTRINCAASWMRRELKGEAVGSVFHELVHVVQQYGRARRSNPSPARTPGWVVEGIPDYIRWYIFEPQSRGAEIAPRNISRARYDGSYRISANFLNWVVDNYDKELIKKLNAAAREGRYQPEIWKTSTGKTVEELGELWKAALEKQAAAPA